MILGTDPALYAYTGGKPFDPARPCVVLLHGAQHDHSVWILQSRWLAHHGYAVLALDLPGHGRSAGPLAGSVESIAERLCTAIAGTGFGPLLLAGHSMGSLIALELAGRLAARGRTVAGVALLGTAFPMRVADTLLAATRETPAAAMAMINVWSHSPSIVPFAASPSNPGPGFNIVWSNLRLMERIAARNGAAVLSTDFAACNAYDGGLAAAAALRCPALFVLGDGDGMTPPRAAQALVEATSHHEVVRLPNCGHAMMAEQPDAVRNALSAFAAKVFATTVA
jgi:pimeloyl-ACP methyl ester carboxylesterase